MKPVLTTTDLTIEIDGLVYTGQFHVGSDSVIVWYGPEKRSAPLRGGARPIDVATTELTEMLRVEIERRSRARNTS
jgi:hypothetical protein